MNDTPVQPATCTSRGTASRLINLAGVILLIVAAALYWRDMQVNKEKAAAAGMVSPVFHDLLNVVSAPMFCSEYWVLSLFGWACLLSASFVKK